MEQNIRLDVNHMMADMLGGEYGVTQAQLADAMGVDQAVISRWESGRVSPNAENLAKLKELLG